MRPWLEPDLLRLRRLVGPDVVGDGLLGRYPERRGVGDGLLSLLRERAAHGDGLLLRYCVPALAGEVYLWRKDGRVAAGEVLLLESLSADVALLGPEVPVLSGERPARRGASLIGDVDGDALALRLVLVLELTLKSSASLASSSPVSVLKPFWVSPLWSHLNLFLNAPTLGVCVDLSATFSSACASAPTSSHWGCAGGCSSRSSPSADGGCRSCSAS